MKIQSAAGSLSATALTLVLALGASACGGKDDHANANNGNSASNANTAAVNTNAVSNTVSNTGNAISNATSGVTDAALKNAIEANLTRYGVTGVTVEVKDKEVTLKGSIPRAKLQDAMKAANEASPKKVNNQLNLQ
jgi:hyperosmotically inducible periplasmic protein